MTLRQRLLLWYTGVLAVAGVALVLTLYFLTAHQLRREIDRFLLDQCEEWRESCREMVADIPSLERRIRYELGTRRYFPTIFRLYDVEDKRDLLFVGNVAWRDAFPTESEFLDPGLVRVYSTQTVGGHGHSLRLLSMRLGSDRYARLVLQGGVYTRRLEMRLGGLRLFLGISVVSVIGLALLGGNFLASRSLRPIEEIASELEKIESENLAYRLAVSPTRDEVARVRLAINRMLDRLEGSFRRIRGFTADAAHELRTPLAALQCRLEVALNKARSSAEYRETVADALSETGALGRTVNDLLLLARMDAQADSLPMEAVPVKQLLAELEEVFSVAAREKGLSLSVECAEECLVLGNRDLLRRLLGNLIDNGLLYTPSGGTVTVQATSDGKEGVICVTDTGVGIPGELQEKIFERFVRADDSRSREAGGTGLGLSICRSIANLHRGMITVRSKLGQGSTFEVRLPAA